MSSVGIKDPKNRLTYYLRRTKEGEEIIVTDRGNPIALIRPLKSAREPRTLEAKLAELAAQRRVTLPSRRPPGNVRMVKAAGEPTSHIIIEDRNEVPRQQRTHKALRRRNRLTA